LVHLALAGAEQQAHCADKLRGGRLMGRFLLWALVVAAVTIAATSIQFHRDLERARSAVREGGRVIETSTGAIEYGERGEGAPLLAIHGAGGGYDQGLSLAMGLVGEDFRVIAPSRFGYLRTPAPEDSSAAAQADAHAALMDALEIQQAVVVGISAGALSAMELALRHPERVRALILIVPAAYSPDNPVTIVENRGNAFVFWVVNNGGDFAWWAAERIAPSMLVRFVGVPPEVVAGASAAERQRVAEVLAAMQPLSARMRGINIDSMGDLHDRPLEQVRAPTLVISARDDLFNTAAAAEHTATRISNAELVLYESGGHLLVGRGEETRAAVRAFLERAAAEH
jgi:pimeloyl-ACP methyl ester carboxylesterase